MGQFMAGLLEALQDLVMGTELVIVLGNPETLEISTMRASLDIRVITEVLMVESLGTLCRRALLMLRASFLDEAKER